MRPILVLSDDDLAALYNFDVVLAGELLNLLLDDVDLNVLSEP